MERMDFFEFGFLFSLRETLRLVTETSDFYVQPFSGDAFTNRQTNVIVLSLLLLLDRQ